MREILFRGKTQQHSRWIYGDLNHYMCDDGMFIAENGHSMHRVFKETVGQYTGLTDINGTKIFENGYMIIDNKTYKVIFDNAEYILTNIFNCDIITLKNNSIKGVFVDEI